jgi:hypothetical protein
VSVFVWRDVGGGAERVEVFGQRAIFWSSDEHLFAVVGEQEDAVLARMADRVRAAE